MSKFHTKSLNHENEMKVARPSATFEHVYADWRSGTIFPLLPTDVKLGKLTSLYTAFCQKHKVKS
jgi:hypothetical protein